jgi:Arc/MetJ-type ribon-helix-helix transcriptional regulator
MTKFTTERKTTLITFRIPQKILNEIDELIREGYFFSRSEAIRQAIIYYLQRFKEERKKQRLWMGP